METTKGVYTYEYPRPSVTTDCVIFGLRPREDFPHGPEASERADTLPVHRF